MSEIRVTRTDASDADFLKLVGELTAFLAVLNGEQDAFYTQFNKVDESIRAVVVYIDDQPVGCGAFRPHSEGTVEIKRMFTDPAMRGQGIGAAVVDELQTWAIEEGFSSAVLETSKRLESAVRLYQRSGFERIPNYAPYEDVEDSVCFEKALVERII